MKKLDMNNIFEDKNKKENKSNPIATGIKGAVIGAGATIIASQILKDEKRVKKVKKVINNVKDEAIQRINLPNNLEDGVKKGTKKLAKQKTVKKLTKKATRAASV
jgi:hypothetical protein